MMKWVYADTIQNPNYYWCKKCALHSNAKIPATMMENPEEIRCDICNSNFLLDS